MLNRTFFFSQVRQTIYLGRLKQSQVDGLNAILDEWEKNWASKDDRWLAYMLATAHHETAATMQPIEEFGKGRGRPYGTNLKMDKRTRYTDTTNLFYGRGYVQLTWYDNYQKAGKKLGIDLIQHPELALVPANASEIMFNGMNMGWFTGKKLSDYFNPTTEDWENARRIINGKDKAILIANYARQFYAALSHTV